jgi:hypothetical protein
VPAGHRGRRTFIYSFIVNTFQGCLAEILALPPCLKIVSDLADRGRMPRDAHIYAGESVRVQAVSGSGRAKGADLHILSEHRGEGPASGVSVLGVVEVKSYPRPWKLLLAQLSSHLRAARRGLAVRGMNYDPKRIEVAAVPVQIAVVPAGWHPPRTFRFVEQGGRSLLHVDPGLPPEETSVITRMSDGSWHVTLRWSKEALAAAAYELTFWYMAKIGQVVYATGVPKEWQPMTPAEAGQNAAKMMLYYAILRTGTALEEQRAIALYNAYGFGYALGTSFTNPKRRREMLWPEDLREILEHGRTKQGCRLRS